MKNKVVRYIRQKNMIQAGEKILVGFSGGADSLALLLCLKELEPELGICVSALHVNHGLRGKEADKDEAFSKEICRLHDIPFESVFCDVPAYAKAERLGEEEAGRILRKRIWNDRIRNRTADRIALAHHKNDAAETFLFHASRGSSLEGLGAIRPVSGLIIRPLLCLERGEIEKWLREKCQEWCTDSSNLEDVQTRNRIRHHILPLLEEEVNPKTVQHLADAAEDMMLADLFIRKQSRACRSEYIQEDSAGGILIKEEISHEDEILQRYMLKAELEKMAGAAKDLERKHILKLQELFSLQTGRRIDLPYGLEARRTYEGIWLGRKAENEEKEIVYALTLEEGIAKVGEESIRVRILPYNGEKIPRLKYTKWFDYDRMKTGLLWRTRRSGDYICINEEGSRQKLKKYFVDQKIPAEKRSGVLLLTSGSEVYWAVGYRTSESARVTEVTQRVLQISIENRNELDEGGK